MTGPTGSISKIVQDVSDLTEVAAADQPRYRQILPAVVLILQILPDTPAMSTECDFHRFPIWSPSEPLIHVTHARRQKPYCCAPSSPDGRDEYSTCHHEREKRVERPNGSMRILQVRCGHQLWLRTQHSFEGTHTLRLLASFNPTSLSQSKSTIARAIKSWWRRLIRSLLGSLPNKKLICG